MSEENKKYDITILSTREDLDLSDIIHKIGGSVIKEKSSEKIRLAYPIEEHESAFMISVVFEALPEAIDKLDPVIKMEKDILRYLLIRYNPKKDIKKTSRSRSAKVENKIPKTDSDKSSSSEKPHKTNKTVDSEKDSLTNEDLEEKIKQLQ